MINLQIEIHNGRVELSGNPILTEVNIVINKNSRIAVVGRNGCGKTTLLRLLRGEIPLSNTEGDGGFRAVSGSPVIGSQDQLAFADDTLTLRREIRGAYIEILNLKKRLDRALAAMQQNGSDENIREYTSLLDRFTAEGGFYFEKEYEAAITKFGFSEEEKERRLNEFSGGQRTKIAFLKLLLSKPDLLLLDEPTNHLDIEAVKWLEEYIASYKKAVVIVSHDRMFLDRTVNEVYEIEYGKTYHYHGNYSSFTVKKRENRALHEKAYSAQQKEISRINATVERFRYKATKAAMVQSKIKSLEKMKLVEAPQRFDERAFHADINPCLISAKEVLSVSGLTVGFEKPLCSVSFNVYRGDRIGIIGGNGLGKSTLLKTVVGKLPPLGGSYKTGAMVKVGYFDQQMAQITGAETVLQNFQDEFHALTDFEARSALGAFLFSGDDVFKTVNMLSGGERVRLALCKLLLKKPNLLILDEPTNHMDIISKEALEDMLVSYTGTLIFVSHDRYFVQKLAKKLLVFKDGGAKWYDCGYDEYLTQNESAEPSGATVLKEQKKSKKAFSTPLKEKSRCERELKRAEERVALLEETLAGLKSEMGFDETQSDYLKLQKLQKEIDETEIQLSAAMTEWEQACERLAEIDSQSAHID